MVRDPARGQGVPEQRHGVPHVEVNERRHARQKQDGKREGGERAASHDQARCSADGSSRKRGPGTGDDRSRRVDQAALGVARWATSARR